MLPLAQAPERPYTAPERHAAAGRRGAPSQRWNPRTAVHRGGILSVAVRPPSAASASLRPASPSPQGGGALRDSHGRFLPLKTPVIWDDISPRWNTSGEHRPLSPRRAKVPSLTSIGAGEPPPEAHFPSPQRTAGSPPRPPRRAASPPRPPRTPRGKALLSSSLREAAHGPSVPTRLVTMPVDERCHLRVDPRPDSARTVRVHPRPPTSRPLSPAGGAREGASVLRPMSARHGPTSARVVSLHARGDASRRPVSAAFRPRPVLRVAVWETEAAARSGTAQALRRSAFPAAGRVARDERGFAVAPAYYPPGRLMRGVPSH